MLGEIASHYRVIERLGAGGMGEVYLAEDMRLHRRVDRAIVYFQRAVEFDPRYARLHGDAEAALDCLEKTARMRRAYTVARARIDPHLEALRGEPRFQQIIGEGKGAGA